MNKFLNSYSPLSYMTNLLHKRAFCWISFTVERNRISLLTGVVVFVCVCVCACPYAGAFACVCVFEFISLPCFGDRAYGVSDAAELD